jgi:hypothetical protein
VALVVLALAAAALVAAQPAQAAVPAHNAPLVYCMKGGTILVDLPTSVSTPLRSERVWVRYHLLKAVNGVWRHEVASETHFSNYATFGGALLSGWLPNANPATWGSFQDDFYVRIAGTYRVAMEIWWTASGAYTYEWAGTHVFSDPWNFIERTGQSCSYS